MSSTPPRPGGLGMPKKRPVTLPSRREIFAGGNNYTIAAEKSKTLTNIRVGAMLYYLSVPLQVIQDEKLDEK
jgi:hypothetical protein